MTQVLLNIYLVGHNKWWDIYAAGLIPVVCFCSHNIFSDVFLVLWRDLENKEFKNAKTSFEMLESTFAPEKFKDFKEFLLPQLKNAHSFRSCDQFFVKQNIFLKK